MSPLTRRGVQRAVIVLLQGICLFAPAGTLAWPAAWWYLGGYVVLVGVGALLLMPHHREVITERSRGTHDAKTWDRWVTTGMAIASFGLLVIAGFDQRWGWTPPWPAWALPVGIGLFAAGYAVVLWAMWANPFFAQGVRIQTERGHSTISTGPYRVIRHPGYLGMATSMLGAALLLGSSYAWICVALYLALLIARTDLEDRTLHAELPGYAAYSSTVKHRILPGIW